MGIGYFEIWRDTTLLFSEDNSHFDIYGYESNGDEFQVGEDLTGNGKANLIIQSDSGGNHCCTKMFVFELDDVFSHLFTTTSRYPIKVVNLDKSLPYEFIKVDSTFDSWRGISYLSEYPQVILRYSGNEPKLADDLMCQPPLETQELDRKRIKISVRNSWSEYGTPPLELWQFMLELIYSGHMDQAMELLEISWPEDIVGKEEFRAEFLERLTHSPYWNDLQTMDCE
jgi:hypothetical protein